MTKQIKNDENAYYYDYPFESQTDNFYGFLMRISKYNLNDSYIATENKKSFYGADDFGNIALFPYNDKSYIFTSMSSFITFFCVSYPILVT